MSAVSLQMRKGIKFLDQVLGPAKNLQVYVVSSPTGSFGYVPESRSLFQPPPGDMELLALKQKGDSAGKHGAIRRWIWAFNIKQGKGSGRCLWHRGTTSSIIVHFSRCSCQNGGHGRQIKSLGGVPCCPWYAFSEQRRSSGRYGL